ncbi:MAG: hypothetical protein U1G07_22110 [Verrucomicrobiota bacterium]
MGKLLFVVVLASMGLKPAAAPFQNLGFDAADTNKAFHPGVIPLQGAIIDFLPGWRITSNSRPVDFLSIDLAPIGFDLAILYSPEASSQGVGAPVEGRFSLTLVPAFDGNRGETLPVWLEQNGDVPPGTDAIHFLAYGSGRLELSLNQSVVPLVYVPRLAGERGIYDVYGDVSRFSGQTVDLRLSGLVSSSSSTQYGLDSISFIVPEPDPLALLAAAGGGALLVGLTRLLRCCPSPGSGRRRKTP